MPLPNLNINYDNAKQGGSAGERDPAPAIFVQKERWEQNCQKENTGKAKTDFDARIQKHAGQRLMDAVGLHKLPTGASFGR